MTASEGSAGLGLPSAANDPSLSTKRLRCVVFSHRPHLAGRVKLLADAPGENGQLRGTVRHVPGEPGLWVLLFGDVLIFTVLFVVYLDRRSLNPALFADSQNHLNRTFGAVNTLILLTSSMLVASAANAVRDKRLHHMAASLTIAGGAMGSCFVVLKAIEYHQKISTGITPSTNEFYMYYFALTGLHLAHVIIGLVVLTALSRLATKPEPTSTQIAFFEGGACFWHMVDLLWIIIFPLLFLVR